MAIIISADEIKKKLPNYSPDKAEEFHHESAAQADKLLAKVLKENINKDVVLLSGGTASGKTEFLATQLYKRDCIIMDATLSTELGAKNKIRQFSQIKFDNRQMLINYLSGKQMTESDIITNISNIK